MDTSRIKGKVNNVKELVLGYRILQQPEHVNTQAAS